MAYGTSLRDIGQNDRGAAFHLMRKTDIDKRNKANARYLFSVQYGFPCQPHPMASLQSQIALPYFFLISIEGIAGKIFQCFLKTASANAKSLARIFAQSSLRSEKVLLAPIDHQQRPVDPQTDFLQIFLL